MFYYGVEGCVFEPNLGPLKTFSKWDRLKATRGEDRAVLSYAVAGIHTAVACLNADPRITGLNHSSAT